MDLLGGRLLYTLHGHKGPVLSAAFSKGGEMFASGGTDTQVLLWKTNFDAFEYKKVLKKHMRRIYTDDPPHLLDIYPRSPHHHHHAKSQSIEINPSYDVTDMQTLDPPVIDISSSSSAVSMIKIYVLSKRNLEDENGQILHTIEEPGTMDEAIGISPVLTNALEHIVEQLDVLTLTVSILEQRLTLTEDKLKECLENQEKLLLSVHQ
ncbi:hypothetical protein JD844_028093 [Phrynosoma platyrhinos]|uniref:POC1 centriolar protein homolog B n=1 Tax=Phrynosoma platyrhinos TaxID=52577 RepID=A0ABQ7SHH1_PHRPL|nr:hypothetical protein JD844_028093 [Phrynosoma platyrhinos]